MTTAVILCGGQGTRLGGIDKPLRALGGRPLIEHVLAQLPAALPKLIVANRNLCAYRGYAVVVDDGEFSGCGPLGGMIAGLTAVADERALVIPGDAPCLPPDLLQRLECAAARDGTDVAVARDGHGLQPLCALLPRRLLRALITFVDAGDYAVHRWWRARNAAHADCADWPSWGWSINTPCEWTSAEAKLGQSVQQKSARGGQSS